MYLYRNGLAVKYTAGTNMVGQMGVLMTTINGRVFLSIQRARKHLFSLANKQNFACSAHLKVLLTSELKWNARQGRNFAVKCGGGVQTPVISS